MAVTLYIGGMKSGKSEVAEREAVRFPAPRLYIATSVVTDDEMKKRVLLHRERRGNLFETVEEPINIANLIAEKASFYNVILVDCLTFWYNNLFYYFEQDDERDSHLKRLENTLKDCNTNIILVTNEVGMGVIPENRLARSFIDFSGRANQKICRIAENAFFVIAGRKLRLE